MPKNTNASANGINRQIRPQNDHYRAGSVDKNKMQLPRMTVPTTVKTTCVFQPLCTKAALRAYFLTVRE